VLRGYTRPETGFVSGAGEFAMAAQVKWQRPPTGVGQRESVARGGAPDAAVLDGGFGDRVLEADAADGGVEGGGADVGVASKFGDRADVGARVGRSLAAAAGP
jgi:hypothetical protein